ncbi:uncharacterized protein LOC144702021 [Wolffia australiana]
MPRGATEETDNAIRGSDVRRASPADTTKPRCLPSTGGRGRTYSLGRRRRRLSPLSSYLDGRQIPTPSRAPPSWPCPEIENMSRDRRHDMSGRGGDDEDDNVDVRDIHALTVVQPPPPPPLPPASSVTSEQFSTMSHEFNALVLAGARVPGGDEDGSGGTPERQAQPSPIQEITIEMVKREEVEAKIASWQAAKVAKINSRFKREDVAIKGWESKHVEKATVALKKVERKLEEKRAKALERMENDVAQTKRKAEEKRASAEAKRAAEVVRVSDMTNLMRALGKAPACR